MNGSSSHKNFTALDIERYHSGLMTERERHDLEKAALDDPFLADAMEGYLMTKTPQDDLAKIRAKLEDGSERKPAPVAHMNYGWIRIAALFIFIALGGWLFVTLTRPNHDSVARLENVKYRDSTPAPATSSSSAPTSSDSSFLDLSSVADDRKADKSANTLKSEQEKKDVAKGATLSYELKAVKDSREPVTISPTTQVDRTNQNFASSQRYEYNNLQAKAKGPFTNRADARYQNVTASNNFLMKETMNSDSLAFVKNQHLNPRNSDVTFSSTDSVVNLNVVLRPLPNSAAEVVVVGHGTKRDTIRWSRPTFLLDSLEPEIGWTKFDDYVASSIKIPEDNKFRKAQTVSGEVQLTFDIGKDGEPVNIKVGRSTCKSCEEKAIRILKEGPKWKQQKNKKGSITLTF